MKYLVDAVLIILYIVGIAIFYPLGNIPIMLVQHFPNEPNVTLNCTQILSNSSANRLASQGNQSPVANSIVGTLNYSNFESPQSACMAAESSPYSHKYEIVVDLLALMLVIEIGFVGGGVYLYKRKKPNLKPG